MVFRNENLENMIRKLERIYNVIIINNNSEIKERFSPNITYPFDNRMRFSAIVNDEFRFLRDNTLFIYSDKTNVKRIPLHEKEWENTLVEYFGFEHSFLKVLGPVPIIGLDL